MTPIYRVHDKPKTIREWFGYSTQAMLSCITATMLISLICGTNISAGLVSAGISTLFFLIITRFNAPIIISNSGATVSAVVGTIALSGAVEQNFLGVIFGGAVVAIVYCAAALLIKRYGTEWITRIITPVMSGAIILVISIQLGFFIPTYAQVNGSYSLIGVLVTMLTMEFVLLFAFYGKGIVKQLAILMGVLCGYLFCILLTVLGIANIVDLSVFSNIRLIVLPDFAFLHASFRTFDWSTLPQIILSFGLVALGALAEHLGDMLNAGNICDEDFIKDPGLTKTLIGDGVGSFIGTLIGAQPNTTYTENLSTILISKCASVYVTAVAAVELILLGFIGAFNAVIVALPNCCFAGASICCYGMIAVSAMRMLSHNVDWNNTKNVWVFAIMLMVGTSGLSIAIGSMNISGICLSIITGIILNVALKESR